MPWKANRDYLSACSYSDKMEEVEWSGSDVSVGCQATCYYCLYCPIPPNTKLAETKLANGRCNKLIFSMDICGK